MSVRQSQTHPLLYLCRTTVQVKTHAQVVLKKLETGKDVFNHVDKMNKTVPITREQRHAQSKSNTVKKDLKKMEADEDDVDSPDTKNKNIPISKRQYFQSKSNTVKRDTISDEIDSSFIRPILSLDLTKRETIYVNENSPILASMYYRLPISELMNTRMDETTQPRTRKVSLSMNNRMKTTTQPRNVRFLMSTRMKEASTQLKTRKVSFSMNTRINKTTQPRNITQPMNIRFLMNTRTKDSPQPRKVSFSSHSTDDCSESFNDNDDPAFTSCPRDYDQYKCGNDEGNTFIGARLLLALRAPSPSVLEVNGERCVGKDLTQLVNSKNTPFMVPPICENGNTNADIGIMKKLMTSRPSQFVRPLDTCNTEKDVRNSLISRMTPIVLPTFIPLDEDSASLSSDDDFTLLSTEAVLEDKNNGVWHRSKHGWKSRRLESSYYTGIKSP